MLWYVEQTVPDPSCKATGTFQCGTINALMPQVYLPKATQGTLAGGVIQGNQVTLTATGTGDADHPNGTVTNTGFISAQQLIINAQQLNNEARNADIGVQTYRTDKQGYTKVTGDEVQPGGFLSAANYQLNVDRVNSISGQFQQINADGTVNQAGSQAVLNNLQAQLGSDFTQSTAQNHIQQEWVQTKKADPTTQIVIIAAAIALSIVTGGTAGVALAGALGATGVAGAAVVAAVGAMASSAFTQLATTGSLDLGTTFEAGAVGAITAGLTQGITYDGGTLGVTNDLSNPNSLANLGGAQSVGNGLTGSAVTQAGTSTATTLGTRIGAAIADSTISAGVQTIIEGGSFGNALKNNLIGAAAAAGANWIGQNIPGIGLSNATGSTIAANIASHALLGCAAASLAGNSCSAGAVGGATSAVLAPAIGSALGITTNADRVDTMNQAAVTALAALAGGTVASALGLQTTTAMTAAQNEALNNYLSQKPTDSVHLTEQQQADNAQANCIATNNCDSATNWAQVSAARDAYVNAVCADPSAPACGAAINAAQAAGNNVMLGGDGLLHIAPIGSPMLQATSNPYASSFDGQVSQGVITGIMLDTGGLGAKALLQAVGKLGAIADAIGGALGGATETGVDATKAIGSIRNGEVLASDGTVLARQNPMTGNYEPVLPGLPVTTVDAATDSGVVTNSNGPLRTTNGVTLNPNLPDPVAGLNYVPTTLNSLNPNIANSQLNGYVGELNLANTVAALPNQQVISYGGAIGTHGADVVSVDVKTGDVTLWDNKFRSSTQSVPSSPTFAPQSNALNGAINQAMNDIDASSLPQSVKDTAIQNLRNGNFNANTVGSGAAKNSTPVKFCNGNPC